MTIAESLLPELDHEVGVTRRLLARVPDGRGEWKPHPKSMSLGQLAIHTVHLLTWGTMTLETTELDLDDPAVQAMGPGSFTTTADLVGRLDGNAARFRRALAAASDGELLVPWTLKQDGSAMFTMPRVSVLRSMVLNHAVHHRGQLSVYLRLLDVPLPGMYGPSADER
jgi:uncharacterized damage-inducible protein DinB